MLLEHSLFSSILIRQSPNYRHSPIHLYVKCFLIFPEIIQKPRIRIPAYIDLVSLQETEFEDAMEQFEEDLERIREERREAKKQEILEQLTEKRLKEGKEQLANEAEEKRRQMDEERMAMREEKMKSEETRGGRVIEERKPYRPPGGRRDEHDDRGEGDAEAIQDAGRNYI